MAKARGFSREIKIRINNIDTMHKLMTLLQSGNRKYENYNKAINNILEKALPAILQEAEPESYLKQNIDQAVGGLHQDLVKRFDAIEKNITKTAFSSMLNQEMNTLLINLTEMLFVQQTGTEVTENMREQLIRNIPEPIKGHLKEYIAIEMSKDKTDSD